MPRVSTGPGIGTFITVLLLCCCCSSIMIAGGYGSLYYCSDKTADFKKFSFKKCKFTEKDRRRLIKKLPKAFKTMAQLEFEKEDDRLTREPPADVDKKPGIIPGLEIVDNDEWLNKSPFECFEIAKGLKDDLVVGWGHRNEEEKDPKRQNSCFVYKKKGKKDEDVMKSFSGVNDDKINVSGCVVPGTKLVDGCLTAEELNAIAERKRLSKMPENINTASGIVPDTTIVENPKWVNMSPFDCYEAVNQLKQTDPLVVGWGHRNAKHPDAKLQNTCFAYTKKSADDFGMSPFSGDVSDEVNISGCMVTGTKLSDGCLTFDDKLGIAEKKRREEAAEAERKRKEEEERKERERQAEEARRQAEEARKEQEAEQAEARRQAEEARKEQEAEQAEARGQAEEERREQEAERRREQEEARKEQEAEQAEARRQAEEERKEREAEEAEARKEREAEEAERRAEQEELRREKEAEEAERRREAEAERQEAIAACFSPETPIKLKCGELVAMKDIKLGDVLFNDAIVDGILQLRNVNDPYYRLYSKALGEYVYVTGTHYVFDGENFVYVQDFHEAERTDEVCDVLSCLITSTHKIPVGEYTFWDWEDNLISQTK